MDATVAGATTSEVVTVDVITGMGGGITTVVAMMAEGGIGNPIETGKYSGALSAAFFCVR